MAKINNKEEASKVLSEKLEKIKQDLAKCQSIADKYGLSFGSPIEVYGMGGEYHGKNVPEGDWRESNAGQWVSSSNNC